MFRHSKRRTRTLAVIALIMGLLSYLLPARHGSFSTLTKAAAANPASAPSSLQGNRAVQQLKEQGQYDSLQAAFAAVRRETNSARVAYPMMIDSTFIQEDKLTTGGWLDGAFGYSVAISFDTAVIGAPPIYNSECPLPGAAYVFVRSGSTWSLQQKLNGDDDGCDSNFGHAVAISGDTIVVGAPDRLDSFNYPGVVYVFSRYRNTHWIKSYKASGNGYFGHSVGISGNAIVVGAPLTSLNNNDKQGAAYVFRRTPSYTYLEQLLVASDRAKNDGFGWSVAISGDTIVIGAPYDDIGSNLGQGSAYVFRRNGNTWSEQQKLTALDGKLQDCFGSSVAIGGPTIVVGILHFLPPPPHSQQTPPGSAYVFVYNNGSWSQQQRLSANDGKPDDQFGYSVAVAGNTIVVGAYGNNSAYVFLRSDNVWSQQQKLLARYVTSDSSFGYSVAISGDRIVVGAPGDNLQGSAYVFVKPYSPGCPCTPVDP
jgi:hypothetical protein